MISLSYTVTALLQDHLKIIETLRRSVLLTPISPYRELKLIWQASLEYIYGTLSLSGVKVTKKHIIEILASPKKRPSPDESAIITTKRTLDFIRHEWIGNPKTITSASVEELALLLFPNDRAKVFRALETKNRDIQQILSYLDVKPEHPVVMAAIIHYAFVADPLLPWAGGRLGRALCSLVLAKYGLNLRGMIAPESVFAESPETYQRSLTTATRDATITSWLEYYTKILITAMERTENEVKKATSGVSGRELSQLSERLFSLNDRQSKILSTLENPTTTITNRVVQKRFKISQITASRDLTKLASLGLLYPHGRGRSVYYTRV